MDIRYLAGRLFKLALFVAFTSPFWGLFFWLRSFAIAAGLGQ